MHFISIDPSVVHPSGAWNNTHSCNHTHTHSHAHTHSLTCSHKHTHTNTDTHPYIHMLTSSDYFGNVFNKLVVVILDVKFHVVPKVN